MNIELFIDKVCKHNNLDLDKLKSKHKAEPYCSYRRAIIFVLRDKKGMKHKEIGVVMNRCTAAITISIQKHNDLYRFNKKYKALVNSMYSISG